MKYRALGNTGLHVSEIGFGAWGIGGDAYGPTDDRESQRALEEAAASGINFFDTSDLYGAGRSETIIGKAFKARRQDVIIATKVGTLPHKSFQMPQDFSSAYLRQGIEASLRRLETDYIDLYQLHSPTLQDLEKTDCVATLQNFQREGKIRAFGISARSPNDALAAISTYGFKVVQVNFNLIDQRALDSGLLELCRSTNTGCIGRTPLGFGYLTGTLTGNEDLSGYDHRVNWPREQLQRWAKAPGLFNRFFAGQAKTAAQFALQFCLAQPSISTIIPGMLTPAQVRENLAASSLPPITPAELHDIFAIYHAHSFYDSSIKQKSLAAK